MGDPRAQLLVHQLDLAFDRRSWHGPNLVGSLRGTSLDAACWRPQPERHNIWEEMVHCAYWKYRVCRLLRPDEYPSFSLKGSDWFARPEERSAAAWRRDLDLLREWHRKLRIEVERLDLSALDESLPGGEFTFVELISGAAAHDVYHAGQIRLLRRMFTESEPS